MYIYILRFFEYVSEWTVPILKFATQKLRRRETLARHVRQTLRQDSELIGGAEPGHRLAFTSKWNFKDRFRGFDGGSLDASKRPETPLEPTFARIPPDPLQRSGRDYPSMRLDPIPTHINTIGHRFCRSVLRNLTARRVGCCCGRQSSDRVAALIFYYHAESCFRDRCATRTNGTLHVDVISTSYTLTSDLHLASPRRPPSTTRCAAAWWPPRKSIQRARARQAWQDRPQPQQ